MKTDSLFKFEYQLIYLYSVYDMKRTQKYVQSDSVKTLAGFSSFS